MSVVSD